MPRNFQLTITGFKSVLDDVRFVLLPAVELSQRGPVYHRTVGYCLARLTQAAAQHLLRIWIVTSQFYPNSRLPMFNEHLKELGYVHSETVRARNAEATIWPGSPPGQRRPPDMKRDPHSFQNSCLGMPTAPRENVGNAGCRPTAESLRSRSEDSALSPESLLQLPARRLDRCSQHRLKACTRRFRGKGLETVEHLEPVFN